MLAIIGIIPLYYFHLTLLYDTIGLLMAIFMLDRADQCRILANQQEILTNQEAMLAILNKTN